MWEFFYVLSLVVKYTYLLIRSFYIQVLAESRGIFSYFQNSRHYSSRFSTSVFSLLNLYSLETVEFAFRKATWKLSFPPECKLNFSCEYVRVEKSFFSLARNILVTVRTRSETSVCKCFDILSSVCVFFINNNQYKNIVHWRSFAM